MAFVYLFDHEPPNELAFAGTAVQSFCLDKIDQLIHRSAKVLGGRTIFCHFFKRLYLMMTSVRRARGRRQPKRAFTQRASLARYSEPIADRLLHLFDCFIYSRCSCHPAHLKLSSAAKHFRCTFVDFGSCRVGLHSISENSVDRAASIMFSSQN